MTLPIILLVAAVDAALALGWAVEHSHSGKPSSLAAAIGMLSLAVFALTAGAMA